MRIIGGNLSRCQSGGLAWHRGHIAGAKRTFVHLLRGSHNFKECGWALEGGGEALAERGELPPVRKSRALYRDLFGRFVWLLP